MEYRQVTIVGCGLIGASFALALRRSGVGERICGWDISTSVLDEALERGIIDEVDDTLSAGAVSTADLIYLAMPVMSIISFLRERGAQVKPGAVITDAGSTKAEVCRVAREYLPKERWFVGGHPVAGSHLTGPAHARATLFENAPYVLATDEADERSEPLITVQEMIRLLGARVVLMGSDHHDRAMALLSHLPQLLSNTLAATISEQPDGNALTEIAGTGYRDMTRLAESSWSVWRDIFATNAVPIANSLGTLMAKLAAVKEELEGCAGCSGADLTKTGALFEQPLQTR